MVGPRTLRCICVLRRIVLWLSAATFLACAALLIFPDLQDFFYSRVYGNEFDARSHWSNCSFPIFDQGPCGACWAMGLAGIMSDAACTHGHEDVALAAQPFLSCASCGHGCRGGGAVHYGPVKYDEFDLCFGWVKANGLPTAQDCPYLSKNCRSDKDHDNGCHSCPAYEGTLWYFSEVSVGQGVRRHLPKQNELMIMEAIKMYGSVLSNFTVFDNFMGYRGGVYASSAETPMVGRHAIRLIGWGKTDDGREYWIVANSWGKRWGEAGYFRFLKGEDLCGIESADKFSAKLESGPAVDNGEPQFLDDVQVVQDLDTKPKWGSVWVAQDVNHRHWHRRIQIPELEQEGTWRVVEMRTSVAAGLHLEITIQDMSGANQTVPVFEPAPMSDRNGILDAARESGDGRGINSFPIITV